MGFSAETRYFMHIMYFAHMLHLAFYEFIMLFC
jgi:hypothetical protein